MDILAILERNGVVDAALAATLQTQLAHGGDPEGILIAANVPVAEILKAKGEYFGVPTRALADKSVPFDTLRNIPEESARHYRFAPLGIEDGVLEVGVTDPDNLEARDALTFISAKLGMPYKIFLISNSDFEKLLSQYKGLAGEVGKALTELEVELGDEDTKKGGLHADDEEVTETSAAAISADAPITKIVATILRHAFEQRASDIHVEALVDQTRVRFRIDGALSTNTTLPAQVHPQVVARIKVLANMKLDEKRKPQDGRFSARVSGSKVDFRVSTFPTHYGEKVVMRILGTDTGALSLEHLGYTPRNLEMIRAAIKKPYGLILVSGPTGSGKSTTLYAILNELDREKQNVLSLEDPIEYTIPGVAQSQMRPDIGYTFANGLRTTLRQDPNVIMVGEIRDSETANLAVQAALTGHLVLSTIHTNNAIGIVPRLLDMGVEPYLIPPVLILGMAQRLVKMLCNGGKQIPVEGAMEAMLVEEFKDLPDAYRKDLPSFKDVFVAKPSADCPTGMKGRTAATEIFEMNADLERSILARQSEEQMFGIVRKKGMLTMREDAIIKSALGVVPFEEVNTLGGTFDISGDESETEYKPELPPKEVAIEKIEKAEAKEKEIEI